MPHEPASASFHETRVIRSKKRRKTVAARVEDGILTVYLPARMSEAEAQGWVERMAERFLGKAKNDALDAQNDLERRARRLNRLYFDGKLTWNSLIYVTNQTSKYGSCSPGSRRIRISHRVASMPAFVLEYIIVHELAHLIEPNHGRRFWRLVQRYPMAERAIGYLMGVGLVSAQERVVEPSLFIPPDDEIDLDAPRASLLPRFVLPPPDASADDIESDCDDDEILDPFDDPALLGGMSS